MKNKIKKISCIFLSSILVFSMVTPVFAEEEEKAPVETQIEVTEQAASDAQEEVKTINDTEVSESVDTSVAALVITDEKVEIVLTESSEIAENINNLETVVNSTEEKIDGAIEELETFEKQEDPIIEDSDSAISNAKIANTTGSEDKARKAKKEAENDLASAEGELAVAENAFDKASEDVAQVEKEYNDIQTQKESIEKQIATAEEALKAAKENSTAALEALKAAQNRLNLLDEKQNKLVEQKEDLEAIQQQYYSMMVYFYRDLLKNNTAYDEDGHLDIKANAELAADLAEEKSTNPNKDVMKLGRNLMEKLVKFMILENGGSEIDFASTGKDRKDTAEGEVFTNNKGQDQTKLIATPQQLWDNVSGESGRNNHVTVTYKDKDGNTVTEYYNYIFKAEQYNDNADLTTGPVYLAMVKYNDESKKWEAAQVNDENNYDDYKKLTETLDAINNLKDYSDAKEAVGKAKEEVEKLQAELDKLKIAQVDDTTINEIKAKLDKAQEDLAEAEKTKVALEDKVEEARKAVAGIDLSRFNVNDDPDDDEPSPSSPTPAPAVVVTPIIPPVLPLSVPSAVVATAVPAVDGIEVEPVRDLGAFVNLEDEELPAAKAPVVTLEDEELPAAQEAEESQVDYFWWIMLLIFLLVLIFLIYIIRKINKSSSDE